MQPSRLGRLRDSRGVTFAVLAVAVSSFTLLQSLIVPLLATVQAEYETTQSTVTWVLTAYLLSASVSTPLLGRIGDVVGKVRVLVVALLLLSIGSLGAALAPSIGWLIAARVLQGIGGGVLPLSFGIIRDEFEERMTLALSVIASLGAVGFGAGIVLAGPIVSGFGLDGLFWLPMVVTFVAAVAALLFVPESPVRTPSRLPVVPAVLLVGWLVSLLLAISQGNTWGWTSTEVLGLFVAGVALLVVWVTVELRAPVPLIDMQMMRRRGVWTSNAVAGGIGFATLGAFAFLPQLVQTPTAAGYGFGASISESGRLLLPSAVASFVVGFSTAALMRRLGARVVITAGTLVTAASMASIALFHDTTWQLYAATIAQGLGSGLVFSSLAGVVVASVPPEQTGVASGMNANIRTIGGSVGAAVLAGVVTAHHGPTGFPAESGYVVGFLVLAAALLVTSVAALWLPDLREQRSGGRLADAADGELGLLPAAGAVPPRSA